MHCQSYEVDDESIGYRKSSRFPIVNNTGRWVRLITVRDHEMAVRALLRRHIATAWQLTIQEVYPEQLINSERGLQVHFCHRLLKQFSDVSRRIFVEPGFVDSDGTSRAPDIVVCHARSIIGVIELKYLPRGRPEYEKDLRTLEWFHSTSDDVELRNDRYMGPDRRSIKRYTLAQDAVLCWAGVYQGPGRLDVESHAVGLGRRFLCLHAVTSDNEAPKLYSSESGGDDL